MKCLCGYEGENYIEKFINNESFLICKKCGNVISIALYKKNGEIKNRKVNKKVLVNSL